MAQPGGRAATPHAIAALALLLLFAAFIKLPRLANLDSIWIDEYGTLAQAVLPRAEMIDNLSRDTLPPASFLILRGWIILGERLGAEPALWARLFGLLFWLPMIPAAFLLARPLLGAPGAWLALLAVAISSPMTDSTQDIRAYAIVVPGALVLLLLLLRAAAGASEADTRWPRQAAFWSAYALLGSLCLWSHQLAAFWLAVLGAGWFAALAGVPAERRRPLLACGFAAQAAIVVGFLPWVPEILLQRRLHIDQGTAWMTPATLSELYSVFAWWLPVGRVFDRWTGAATLLPLTVLLVPALALRFLPARDGAAEQAPAAARAAGASLLLAAAYVVLTWFIAALEIARTFHGPRYTFLAAGPFAFGIVAMAVAASRGRSPWLAWALAAPLLAASFLGANAVARQEHHAGSAGYLKNAQPPFDPATPVFVVPANLFQYLAPALDGWNAHPGTALSTWAEPVERLIVFEASPFPFDKQPEDLLVLERLLNARLGEAQKRRALPQGGMALAHATVIENPRVEEFPTLFANGPLPVPHDTPPGAACTAFPEGQRHRDGWSVIEIDRDGRSYRWGTGYKTLTLRFDGDVKQPGDYVARIRYFRQPYPKETVPIEYWYRGVPRVVEMPAGAGTVDLPLRIDEPDAAPELRIITPDWRPGDFIPGDPDGRRLTFLFQAAWIERAP
ncbi:MAG: hypothetical protein SF028_02370 [Candidatus Sumerlaeia bacterium]|nr:hypothetical protein [Candidatus Sumerlaeia bacterium]